MMRRDLDGMGNDCMRSDGTRKDGMRNCDFVWSVSMRKVSHKFPEKFNHFI